jgi:hypothetical protein
LYTKEVSSKLGNSCKIKKIKSRKRIIANDDPDIMLKMPLIFGTYKPVKKFINGRPADANKNKNTLYTSLAYVKP